MARDAIEAEGTISVCAHVPEKKATIQSKKGEKEPELGATCNLRLLHAPIAIKRMAVRDGRAVHWAHKPTSTTTGQRSLADVGCGAAAAAAIGVIMSGERHLRQVCRPVTAAAAVAVLAALVATAVESNSISLFRRNGPQHTLSLIDCIDSVSTSLSLGNE